MQQLLIAGADGLPEWQMLWDLLVAWLKDWQFLVGSLIALIAGMITVRAINHQIRERRVESEEQRRRLVRAYRASMPEDLHAICSYARRSAETVQEALLIINEQEVGQQMLSRRGRTSRLRCPTLPTYVLMNLKALIEHLDHANGEEVADLLGCYHNQHARLNGTLEGFDRSNSGAITISRNVSFNPVLKNTLELYLRAKGMLPFARGETDSVSLKFETSEILKALKELNIDQVISPEAREYCLRFLSLKIRAA